MSVDSFLATLVPMFLIVNPIGLVPLFLVLTANTSDSHKRKMAIKGPLVGLFILLLFGFVGEALLRTLGISYPAFRTGGGILLLLTALNMVFEKRQKQHKQTASKFNRDNNQDADDNFEDVSVFPMGTLLIAGPGAITAVMLLMSDHGVNLTGQLIVVLAITMIMVCTLILLLLANKVSNFLPETITNVISRILGLLLTALSVQFIFDGVKVTFFV